MVKVQDHLKTRADAPRLACDVTPEQITQILERLERLTITAANLTARVNALSSDVPPRAVQLGQQRREKRLPARRVGP